MRTAVLILALTAGIAAPAASGYDRTPITLYGLYSDGWGNSTSKAERALISRYQGIKSIGCTGVIMGDDRSGSSWVDGLTRFWDKLACGGHTWSGVPFALVYDAKGTYAWIIYRLRGVTISALRYG